jgi:hypothetical protein
VVSTQSTTLHPSSIFFFFFFSFFGETFILNITVNEI